MFINETIAPSACRNGARRFQRAFRGAGERPPRRVTRPVGDTVPMGAGAYATIDALEPYRHLVAQEAYVLRPLPGNKTRLVMRYRGLGFVAPADRAIRPDAGPVPQLLRFAVLHVPGVDLALRAFDLFISDPLHHYMETGMLTGIKARAEVGYAHVNGHTDGAATILESLVGACWAVRP